MNNIETLKAQQSSLDLASSLLHADRMSMLDKLELQYYRQRALLSSSLLDPLAYKSVLSAPPLLGLTAPSYLAARGPSYLDALIAQRLTSQTSRALDRADWLLYQDLLAKAKAAPNASAAKPAADDTTVTSTTTAVSDAVVQDKDQDKTTDKSGEKDTDSDSSTAGKSKPRKASQRWWDNYNEVKRVYDEHGHLTMPEQRLRHWLSYQRNHASSLTDEQKEALERIQYRKISNFRKSDEEDWQANFKRLISDPSAQEDEKIKRWIGRQRRLKQLGELSAQRTKMLEEHVYLGTKNGLCGKRKRSGEKRNAYWSEMFERLLEYQKKNGDLNVPARYPEDKSLGYWVLEQRRRFRQTDKDGLQKMEQDKIDKLNSIGFVWNIKPLKK